MPSTLHPTSLPARLEEPCQCFARLRLSIRAVVAVFKKKLSSLKTDTGTLLLNHEIFFGCTVFFPTEKVEKEQKYSVFLKNTCFSINIKGNKPKKSSLAQHGCFCRFTRATCSSAHQRAMSAVWRAAFRRRCPITLTNTPPPRKRGRPRSRKASRPARHKVTRISSIRNTPFSSYWRHFRCSAGSHILLFKR